ncbi:hypothetical protein RJT34_12731 [Clitoria ternatea]|uniref:Uncharacterized protein n=1 Tax=Clitoria ternatea TaxID=43366 RepID=A0AAN9JMB7_CLITE
MVRGFGGGVGYCGGFDKEKVVVVLRWEIVDYGMKNERRFWLEVMIVKEDGGHRVVGGEEEEGCGGFGGWEKKRLWVSEIR